MVRSYACFFRPVGSTRFWPYFVTAMRLCSAFRTDPEEVKSVESQCVDVCLLALDADELPVEATGPKPDGQRVLAS